MLGLWVPVSPILVTLTLCFLFSAVCEVATLDEDCMDNV